MNTREIRQLDIAVRRDFVPHVYRDGQQEQDVKLLSKGLAAMAVQILTGWDRSRAGATVIDGSMDNGIDAIAASKQMNSLFSFNRSGARQVTRPLIRVRQINLSMARRCSGQDCSIASMRGCRYSGPGLRTFFSNPGRALF